MMRLFISYRRADSADAVGRIFEHLVEQLGPDSVFKDVDSIPPGSDFRQVTGEAISDCEAVLVVIGPDWLPQNDRGQRRLDDSADPVHSELSAAFSSGARVIPVLVRGAQMPKPDDLPEALTRLSYLHAIQVRPDPDFKSDMSRLLEVLVAMGFVAKPNSKPIGKRVLGCTVTLAISFCVLLAVLSQIELQVRPISSYPSPSEINLGRFAAADNVEHVLPGKPAIIHLRNWHYVTKDAFAANEGLQGVELDREYEKAMKAAADVHASLKLILADVDEVYVEGLTDQNQNLAAAEIASLAAYHTLLMREGGEDPDHEQTLLRLGPAADLLLDGKPIKLLPAEGVEHEAARPVKGKIDDKLNAEREAAIVRRIVARGKTAVLVLGGDHDLTEAIRPTEWGYVRVTPKGYPE